MDARDRRVALIASAGFVLTLSALIGLPGPNFTFMSLAPAIAIASGFPAMLALYSQRSSAVGGFSRALFTAGAVALIAVGIVYTGTASLLRVVLAYFLPAALYLGAAAVLAAPGMRRDATT